MIVQGIRSAKHDRMCNLILYAINHNNQFTASDTDSHVIKRLLKEGLITRIATGKYQLNLDRLRQVSYIVPDTLWEKLSDPEYQRQIKGTKPNNVKVSKARLARKRANKYRTSDSNSTFKLSDIIMGGKHGKSTF